VPVPYEIGSNKVLREVKPRYPSRPDRPEHWRPRTKPPSKAERLVRFVDAMYKQEQDIRECMRPDPATLKAWLQRGELQV
jgi:hypothetical protein